MKSIILLACILLAGCVLAEPEVTTEPLEKPESPTKDPESPSKDKDPESPAKDKDPESPAKVKEPESPAKDKDAEPPAEESTVGNTKLSLNAVEKKEGDDNKSVETTPGSVKDDDDKLKLVALKSDKKDTSEEQSTISTTLGSSEETGDKADKKANKKDESNSNVTTPAPASGEEGVKVSPPVPNASQKPDAKLNTNLDADAKPVDIKAKENPLVIGDTTPKAIADHKMTATEQQAYVCSLEKFDLCPMTVDLEDLVGIAQPEDNARCKALAATMGYSGFCVVLMKTDPDTGDAIYTRTCAYYDASNKKTTCNTNFLTTTTVTNQTQIQYKCKNGISHYIPTSCVKKHKELVLA